MNGKMRAGIILRIAGVPKTNRKIVARLPVQNAIGRPSMSKRPSEPNSSRVSHTIGISMPISLSSLSPDQHDVLEELGYALQHDQRRPDRQGELHRSEERRVGKECRSRW